MPQLDPTTFGEWLRRRRKTLGLTQAALARKVGCATITIQKIEAEERRPSPEMALWLAEACEISATEHKRFLRLSRAGRGLSTREQVALERPPTNLPLALPPLIGRESDLAAARKRILQDGARLLSITGPPGVGKTALSLHLAMGVLSAFEDGGFFVSLADATTAEALVAAIAQTLAVNEAGVATPRRLKEYLSGKLLLLVLDNLEQARSEAAVVADLLAACPWLTVVATTRAPLRVRAERRLLLAPLALPDEARGYSVDSVAESPAASLFVERAQAVKGDFALTAANAPTVARICQRLAGLPLAIELVAARASVLTPEVLLERLGGRVLLDTAGLHDVPDRQRTMRTAIDWSCELLSPYERALFARLAVCSGEFSLEAAEALAPASAAGAAKGPPGRLDALASLVDKGLVVRRDDAGEPRFRLLEPLREYAFDALEKAGELLDARRCHAEHHLSVALGAEAHLRGAGQVAWLDRLERERANLLVALGFLLGPDGDGAIGLRLANSLSWFWNVRGYPSEGRSWIRQALQAPERPDIPPHERARAIAALAMFEWQEGELDAARGRIDDSLRLYRRVGGASRDHALALCVQAMVAVFQEDQATALAAGEEAVRMSRRLDDRWTVALAMNPIGKARLQQHDVDAARAEFERSLAIFKELGDEWGAGIPLMNLGVMEAAGGRRAEARARLEESVRLFGSVGERWMRALVLDGLASLLAADGETARATAARRESLEILNRMGLTASVAIVVLSFARVLQSHGDHEEALALFEQSLDLLLEQRLPAETAHCLIGLAGAAVDCGDLRRAARVLGAADRVVEASGLVLAPEDVAERDRTMNGVRAALDEAAVNSEWLRGRTMG